MEAVHAYTSFNMRSGASHSSLCLHISMIFCGKCFHELYYMAYSFQCNIYTLAYGFVFLDPISRPL